MITPLLRPAAYVKDDDTKKELELKKYQIEEAYLDLVAFGGGEEEEEDGSDSSEISSDSNDNR